MYSGFSRAITDMTGYLDIINNTITLLTTSVGISLLYGYNNVSNNTIEGVGSSMTGINTPPVAQNILLFNNTINNTGIALHLLSSYDDIYYNNLTNNDIGIRLTSSV